MTQEMTEEQKARLKAMGINIKGKVTAKRSIVEGNQHNVIVGSDEASQPVGPVEGVDQASRGTGEDFVLGKVITRVVRGGGERKA